MSNSTPIFARLVIWLMAITMPVHNLPAASCGCSVGGIQANFNGQTCCCALAEQEAGTCCCSRKGLNSAPSCCGQSSETSGSPCQCGENCRCGQSEPTQPFTPVSPETPTEKVAQDASSSSSNTPLLTPQAAEDYPKTSATSDASTALDRCATLCRFTL